MDEGVAQLFILELNGRKVIGTVGALQFEVIQYRLLHEYGAKCNFENLNVYKACWIEANDDSTDFIEFQRIKQKFLAKDKSGKLVFRGRYGVFEDSFRTANHLFFRPRAGPC